MPRMMIHQQLHDIATPHDHDVLSGRGNFVNYHAGNEHFRSLVRKHKVAYVACPKQQKGKFSRLIVEEIRARNPPGRFLKQDPVTKLWHDIGEKKALDKTRQALREGAPDIMKEMSGDDADGSPEGGGSDEETRKSPIPSVRISTGDSSLCILLFVLHTSHAMIKLHFYHIYFAGSRSGRSCEISHKLSNAIQ